MRPENEELVMSPVNLFKHISYGANAWGNLSLFRGDLSFSSRLNVSQPIVEPFVLKLDR